MSEEHKQAISRAKKGKVVVSPEQRELLRAINLGKKYSDETKRKHSEQMMGNTHAKGSKGWVGKRHSESSKEKMRKAAKGRPPPSLTEASREKMRAAALRREATKKDNGYKISESTRAVLSERHKQSWKNPEIRQRRTEALRRAWQRRKSAIDNSGETDTMS